MNKTLKLALVAGTVLFAVPSYGMRKVFEQPKRILKALIMHARNTQNFLHLTHKKYKEIRSNNKKLKEAKFDCNYEKNINNVNKFYGHPDNKKNYEKKT